MIKKIKAILLKERGNKFYRFLDYYVGIPIVFLFGIFKRKNQNLNSEVKCIGLLKTAGIGDIVILSAIVNEIKNRYPHCKIVLFVGSNNYEIAKIMNRGIIIEKISFLNLLKSIKLIRNYKFDYFVDFDPWPRINAILSFFSKSKVKIGFKTNKQFRHYIYDLIVVHSNRIHEIDNYRNLVRFFINDFKFFPEIKLDYSIKANFAVVHMYAGGINSQLKEMSESGYINLILKILPFFDRIYLTGSKTDSNKIDKILKALNDKKIISVAGKLDLIGVIKLIGAAKVVISVNTGIMHIASAIGTPLIALHGPTNPQRWGPLSKNSIIIKSTLACSPCLNLGFEYGCKKNKCMQAIDIDDIVEKLKIIIGINKSRLSC